jgi:hypothetical protein
VQRRREEGVYPEARVVTVVAVDALGEFPARGAPVDIGAGERDDPVDVAFGIDSTRIELVSAEDGVAGRIT